MYLTRLEINGFKSFAHKTVFEFPSGIVAIVGPNGSGKSNVIDSVRWILGERETKHLRSDHIEDLIFSGTPKKPRMSQAQVTLVFDNSSGAFPIDFSEVVITRKVARNGTSEYLINDAPVRLKDIVSFFSTIRLGSRGLSVIGQGSGDIFVTSNPQQRMVMVQEILGLREYELKKAESERKLARTYTNLETIEAMMKEVLPRLRTLKRQTTKWEKRSEIQQELDTILENFFISKISALNKQREKVLAPLPDIEKQHKHCSAELVEAQNKLEGVEQLGTTQDTVQKLHVKKSALFQKRREIERSLLRIEAEQERDQNDVSLSADQARSILSDIRGILKKSSDSDSLDVLKQSVHKALEIIGGVFSKKTSQQPSDSQAQYKNLTKQLNELEKDIEAIEEQEKEYAHQTETFTTRFKEAFSHVEELKDVLSELQDKKQHITFEEEKNTYHIQELEHQVRSFEAPLKQYQQKALSEKAASYSLSDLDDMERKIVKLRGELASIGEIDESLLNEAKEVDEHYTFLKQEFTDLEDASQNLTILIKELEDTITKEFKASFKKVNSAFNEYFRTMFGGGSAKMRVTKKVVEISTDEQDVQEEQEKLGGIELEVSIPQKKITGLDMLSGGERSLVSLAVMFALVSVSPPPFLVLDEVDASLDEKNSARFVQLVKKFSKHTQFIVVTHNRVTMQEADILYGVTMDDAGVSKILSLKLEDAKEVAKET